MAVASRLDMGPLVAKGKLAVVDYHLPKISTALTVTPLPPLWRGDRGAARFDLRALAQFNLI